MTSSSVLFKPFCTCGKSAKCSVLQAVSHEHRISDYYSHRITLQPIRQRLLAFRISVTFNLVLCCHPLLLTSTLNSCWWFGWIHRRDEGHGLTFVYIEGYSLHKFCCFFPTDPQRERQTCGQSIHLMPFESTPVADMEMLLIEQITWTLVPPVCCHLHH